MKDTPQKLDKQKIDEFWQRRTQQSDSRIATHFKQDEALDYDVAFIKPYLPPQAHVLDLGCGTGAIALEIANDCSYIRAVDKVGAFLTSCANASNISTHQADIASYHDQHQYDVILIFGVLNYLEESETITTYQHCFSMLKPGGHLIVKHACGVQEDVVIDKFSEEINDWYHAVYRFHEKERELLAKVFDQVQVFDIYPPKLNRWQNTHYYAFVAKKTESC